MRRVSGERGKRERERVRGYIYEAGGGAPRAEVRERSHGEGGKRGEEGEKGLGQRKEGEEWVRQG